MKQRGKVIIVNDGCYQPSPERVLVTSVCRDAYTDLPEYKMPSSISSNGFQDGFGEYSTHLPEEFKFYTKQRCYGMSFLEENVKGPTYLHFPHSGELESYLSSGKYDVLGISAYTWSFPWAIRIAERAKMLYGLKQVWLGGYAVMTDDAATIKYFDRLFWGYSESNLSQSIGLPSMATDCIRHPDLATDAFFLGKKSTVGHLIFKRGCQNHCSYCADPVFQPGGEGSLSFESIEKILDIYQEKGIRTIYFSNQNTNMLTKTGNKILDGMYRRNMRFGMLTSFRALSYKGLDEIKRLHDKGMIFLLLGLESLDDQNLIRTERKARFKEMYDILMLLQKLRVTITTTYMICFENDTAQTIREAKSKMIDELGVTVCLFNITMPLPGTPMYWEYKQRKLICDWNWTHWTGNYLVWKHPVISPEQALELLSEMRSEVNSPDYNPNVRAIWESRTKESDKNDSKKHTSGENKHYLGTEKQPVSIL